MSRVVIFVAQNDEGSRLLDDYILPLCGRLGLTPDPREPTDRRVSIEAQVVARFIIWDGSVEPGLFSNGGCLRW